MSIGQLKQSGQSDDGRFKFVCEQCGMAVRHRDQHAVPAPHQCREPAPTNGPGSHLKRMFRDEIGIADCRACRVMARRMDRLGVDGCCRQRNELASELQKRADKKGWGTTLVAAVGSLKSGLALRLKPWDLYGSLIDEACRRATLAQSA